MNGPDALVTALSETKKYAYLCPALVRRVAREEFSKYPRDKERLKAIKNRLHQIYGAYVDDGGLDRAAKLLDALGPDADRAALEEACRKALALHVSTRERLGALEAFYGFVLDGDVPIRSVMDLGCGLHPLALPLLHLTELTRYYAYDLDLRIAALVNVLLARLGLGPDAASMDLVEETPEAQVDLVFALKLLPVLESQRKGRGVALLEQLRARRLVVSFPVRSLSGRGKGMERGYATGFEPRFASRFDIIRKQVIGQELVYVLKPFAP